MPTKPLKTGALVRIRKGTALSSTNPSKRHFVAGRDYVVKIHDSYGGYTHDGEERLAQVLWAGAHGYWTYANVKDVEALDSKDYLMVCDCGR